MKAFILKSCIALAITLTLSDYSSGQPYWHIQNSGTTSNLNSIKHRPTVIGEIFIAGDNGVILLTTNYGLAWERVNSGTDADLTSIEFLSSETALICGSGGTMLESTDGGRNWHSVVTNTTHNINDVVLSQYPTTIYAVGDEGLFMSLTNGVWTSSIIDTSDYNSLLVEFGFNTPRRIFVGGDYGEMRLSTNNGITWTRLNTGIQGNINRATDETTFQFVCDGGKVIYTNGSQIFVNNSGTTNDLHGVSSSNGIVYCGKNGTVLKNSVPVLTYTNKKLNAVYLPNNYETFIVGDSALIMFTRNINESQRSKMMNGNNISTWYNSNGWFNQVPGFFSGFEWPKGSGKYAKFSSGMMIGGLVGNDTLVVACDYNSEYLPGQTIGGVPYGNGTSDFRLYKLTHNTNDSDRMKWPNIQLGNSDQGAPVYYDSGSGILKPSDFGNQTMFSSFTDSYDSSHVYFPGRTRPLKADVKQITFGFNQPEELKNVIYQEYKIINRCNTQWRDFYICMYSDDDLGRASDDREGVDTVYGLAYTYNGGDFDEEYGQSPPATGFSIVRSPTAFTGNQNDTVAYYEGKNKRVRTGVKEIGMSSTIIFTDDTWQPQNYGSLYNTMKGLKFDGSPYINPLNSQPTKYIFSGDPVTNTGWVQGTHFDMRFYQNFGPVNMNPGDTQVIVIAQVIARGNSYLNSITKLRETTQTAKEYYDNMFSGVNIGISTISNTIPRKHTLYQNYPNPFNPVTHIKFEIASATFTMLKVFDITGREIKILVDENLNAGTYSVPFSAEDIGSGVYFYRLEAGDIIDTKKMILIR